MDSTLRATLEQRLGVAFAKTLEASPSQTLKPEPPDPSRSVPLPVLSLAPSSGDGELEVRRLLGEGGMGRVDLVYQRSLQREVAVKTTRPGASPGTVAALVREARVAGMLEHPGVVPVHLLGVDGTGAPILVMKRIEGLDWETLIGSPEHPAWLGRPGDRMVAHVEILMQLCRTVEFAHRRGILHLDIKPENVMLGEFGEVYLVDWGIARSFGPDRPAEAALAGTPAYMAPEVVTGTGVDARTDVYLLGATLHAALTGTARHPGTDVMTVLASALRSEPFAYDAAIPAELADICNRATARERSDRFSSAEALRLALAAHLGHRSAVALAGRGRERSDALAALLDAAQPGVPAELPRAYRLVNEARFALEQALREYPEDESTQAAFTTCIGRAVELEIRQGHVGVARALLGELDPAPPALRARVDEVAAAAARAASERERHRAIAHDHDANVGARQRTVAVALYSIASVAGSASILAKADSLRPRDMIAVASAVVVGTVSLVFWMRARLLVNAFGRQTSIMFVFGGIAMLLDRIVCARLGLDVPATLTFDVLVLFLIIGSVSATIVRPLWPLALGFFVSLVLCLAFPARAFVVFAVDVLLLPPGLVLALRAHARRAQSTK